MPICKDNERKEKQLLKFLHAQSEKGSKTKSIQMMTVQKEVAAASSGGQGLHSLGGSFLVV